MQEIAWLDVHHVPPRYYVSLRYILLGHEAQWVVIPEGDPEGVNYCILLPRGTMHQRFQHGDCERYLCYRLIFPDTYTILYYRHRENNTVSLYLPVL